MKHEPTSLGVSHTSASRGYDSHWCARLPGMHRGYYQSFASPPHFDSAHTYQFITYHLADSLPQSKFREIQNSLKNLPSDKVDQKKRKLVEKYLDAGYGSCVLRKPECAKIVISTWQLFHGVRYELIAWVVMPNHVHILIRQYEGWSLGKIVLSWKNYTAREINKRYSRVQMQSEAVARTGVRDSQGYFVRFEADVCTKHPWEHRTPVRSEAAIGTKAQGIWQRGYWDRAIRDERHFRKTIEYIHFNPVQAGLALKPEDWLWSSSYQPLL